MRKRLSSTLIRANLTRRKLPWLLCSCRLSRCAYACILVYRRCQSLGGYIALWTSFPSCFLQRSVHYILLLISWRARLMQLQSQVQQFSGKYAPQPTTQADIPCTHNMEHLLPSLDPGALSALYQRHARQFMMYIGFPLFTEVWTNVWRWSHVLLDRNTFNHVCETSRVFGRFISSSEKLVCRCGRQRLAHALSLPELLKEFRFLLFPPFSSRELLIFVLSCKRALHLAF